MERSGSLSEIEIIGVAAAAAAALGGIVIALGRGQQEASRQPSGVAAIASAVDRGRIDTQQVRRSANRAAEEVGRRLPEVRDAAEDISHRAAESARQAAKPARKELQRAARQASKRLQEAESRAPSRDEAGSLVRDLVGVLAGNLRQYADQAAARSEELAAKSRTLKEDVSQAARERTDETHLDLGTRLRETVFPVLQTAAATTSQRTSEALESARERAESAVESSASDDGRASRAVAQVQESGQQIVSGTTQAAKDTAATLVWLSIASAVVYFAMLSPERREKVKSALCGGLEQVRLLALDFKGYEPEM